MTDAKHTPPERLVEALVRTKTPRQLAIAYLRASRRARNAEAAFGVYSELSDALEAAKAGDGETALSSLRKATGTLRTNREVNES